MHTSGGQLTVKRFTARYDSECNGCLGEIWEGDEAGYVEGEVMCELCCDVEDDDG